MIYYRHMLRKVRCQFGRLWHWSWRVSPTTLLAVKSKISGSLEAGEYCHVGPHAIIPPGVKFGNYVLIGPGFYVVGNDHNFNVSGVPVIFSGRPRRKKTIIGSDVWIGARVTLMRGVNVGHGAIIGSGSVVTKNVPSYSISVGVPARVIGTRFSENEIDRHNIALENNEFKSSFVEHES